MTRFGKIPPLLPIFKNIWQYIWGLFGFGQSFQLTLVQFVCFWANFHCWKWPNIENTIWSSGHTGMALVIYQRNLDSSFRTNLQLARNLHPVRSFLSLSLSLSLYLYLSLSLTSLSNHRSHFLSSLNPDSFFLSTNVTRFGEILPLLHNIEKLWPFWKGSFSIWLNFEIIWAIFYAFGKIYIVENGQILNK